MLILPGVAEPRLESRPAFPLLLRGSGFCTELHRHSPSLCTYILVISIVQVAFRFAKTPTGTPNVETPVRSNASANQSGPRIQQATALYWQACDNWKHDDPNHTIPLHKNCTVAHDIAVQCVLWSLLTAVVVTINLQ